MKDEIANSFGDELINLMEADDWTNESLAEEINVSTDSISLWRNNKSLPSPPNYARLLDEIGLDRDRDADTEQISRLDHLLAEARAKKRTPSEFLGDTNRFPSSAPSPIVREKVDKLLDAEILSNDPKIVVIHAPGGSGKTTSVRNWIDRREGKLRSRFDKVFLWSFYRQGQTPEFVTVDPLFEALVLFLGGTISPSDSTRAKALKCIAELRKESVLLVIDGVEAIQYPPGDELRREGRFKDDDTQDFFLQLLNVQHGACVITSRIETAFNRPASEASVVQWELPELTHPEGIALIRGSGIDGTDEELLQYVEGCQGHPLALMLVCNFIRRAYKNRLPSWSEVSLNAPNSLPGAKLAERILSGYLSWLPPAERALLSICGLFDHPIECDLVFQLTNALISETAFRFDKLHNLRWFRFHLQTLRSTLLIYEDDHDFIDTHPLIREYLGALLESEQPELWRAANRAMYALLSERREDDWQLRRIVFGCRGGLADRAFVEAYQPRFSISAGTLQRDMTVSYGAILYAVNAFFKGGSTAGLNARLQPEVQQVLLLDAISLVTALRGYADPQLPILFSTARSLTDINDAGVIRVAYAETRYFRMAGEFSASKRAYKRLFHLAEGRKDAGLEVGAFRNACAHSFYVADFAEARRLSEIGEGKKYNEDWRVDPIGFVNNPVVMLAGYGSLASAMLDDWEAATMARERMRAAVARSGDPHSAAIALFIETMLCDLGLETNRLDETAQRFEQLAAAGELTQWLIAANILRAYAADAPAADFTRLISRWNETGARLFLPYWNAMAADSARKIGEAQAAVEFAARGLDIAHQTGETWANPRLQAHLET